MKSTEQYNPINLNLKFYIEGDRTQNMQIKVISITAFLFIYTVVITFSIIISSLEI